MELTATAAVTYWRFGGPNLEARERHPLPNDVWDQVRAQILSLRRRAEQARDRRGAIGEAIEYADETVVYEAQWRVEDSEFENDVSEADFDWVKATPRAQVRAEMERLAEVARGLEREVEAVQRQHPQMTPDMWREMLCGRGYAKHTNFALERIEGAF